MVGGQLRVSDSSDTDVIITHTFQQEKQQKLESTVTGKNQELEQSVT